MAVPLLFIRVNNSHDWGDDFAQYLLQSKYLTGEVDGLLVSETATHGPGVKGVLFSVLLIPAILSTDSYEIIAGKLMVSLTLILSGLALLLFFTRYFGKFNALILALAVVYNFQMIRIKDQILPDFLFGALVVFSMLLFFSSSRHVFYFGLLLAGLSVGVKSAGIAVVLTSALGMFFSCHRFTQTITEKLRGTAILAIPVLLIYLFEIYISSAKPSVIWYSMATAKSAGFSMIAENFNAYKTGFFSFIEFEVPAIFNTIIRWICVALLIAGFGYRVIKKSGWPELFLVIYITFLLFYPYSRDPVRFLVPAFPLMVYYMGSAFLLVADYLKAKQAFSVVLIILALLTLQTLRLELRRPTEYTTQSADTKELFDFLKTNIQPGELVADTKPWAVSYYTGVSCVPFGAAYLSNYRILRLAGNSNVLGNVLSGDSVTFENESFTVIINNPD